MSEEKIEHSPLPWQARQVITWHSGEITNILDKDGVYVAGEVYDHNIDFIVTACNSYYDNKAVIAELVEALEQNNAFVERLIGFVAGTHDMKATNLADHMNGLLAINDEVLAKHKAGK